MFYSKMLIYSIGLWVNWISLRAAFLLSTPIAATVLYCSCFNSNSNLKPKPKPKLEPEPKTQTQNQN